MYIPFLWGFYVGFCLVTFLVLLFFLTRKRKLVDLLVLSFLCLVTVIVLWIFPTVSWVGLQCVNTVFPDYTHLFFYNCKIHDQS